MINWTRLARKQDAAQAAFSTLQTIGKYLSAGDKTSNNCVHQVLRSVSASRLLLRIADQTVLYFPDLSTEISSSFPWFEQQFKKGFSSWMRTDVTNVETLRYNYTAVKRIIEIDLRLFQSRTRFKWWRWWWKNVIPKKRKGLFDYSFS